MLPDAHLIIDGHPIPIEPDWQASSDAEGGYDRFSARVPLSHIRRFSLSQESQAILYDNSAEVLWYGTLVQDPQVEGEVARLEAEGPRGAAEREGGRWLAQSREVGLWADRLGEPFNIGQQRNYDTVSNPTHLLLKAPRGEDFTSAHSDGFVLWAPGTPGGLQRYAFTIHRNRDQGALDLITSRFAGPGGGRTTIQTHGLNTGNPTVISQAVTGGQDALDLVMSANTGFTQGQVMICRLFNLRVNGVWGNTGRAANYDIMYPDEGATDVFTRLGWSSSNTPIDTNVLPLDHDGSYADLLSYLCELVDFCWLAPPTPTGSAVFRPWGNKTHHVFNGGIFNLAKLRLFNKVTVPYETVGGARHEASAVPTLDPLPGVTREYVYEGLSDPQAPPVGGNNLAREVAQTLANLLGTPRWAGSVDLVKTREGSPYLIRPGDLIVEENADSGEARTHRVWSTTLSRSGVQVGIEDRVSVEGLVELAGMSRARTVRKPRKKRRKKKRKR